MNLAYSWPQGDNHGLMSKIHGSFSRLKIMDSAQYTHKFSAFTTHNPISYDFHLMWGFRDLKMMPESFLK
jgi:hypothetical protein